MSLDVRTHESVWDAVADEAGEAANLKLRSHLMDILEAYIGREGITQGEASRRFAVPRSRLASPWNRNRVRDPAPKQRVRPLGRGRSRPGGREQGTAISRSSSLSTGRLVRIRARSENRPIAFGSHGSGEVANRAGRTAGLASRPLPVWIACSRERRAPRS